MDIDELTNSLGNFTFEKPDKPPQLPEKKNRRSVGRSASTSETKNEVTSSALASRVSRSDSLPSPRPRKAKIYAKNVPNPDLPSGND